MLLFLGKVTDNNGRKRRNCVGENEPQTYSRMMKFLHGAYNGRTEGERGQGAQSGQKVKVRAASLHAGQTYLLGLSKPLDVCFARQALDAIDPATISAVMPAEKQVVEEQEGGVFEK